MRSKATSSLRSCHDEGVADADKRSEIEKLLAETEAALGTGSRAVPLPTPDASGRRSDGFAQRVTFAAFAAGVGAGAVWLLFAFLPFLGSISGAAGAFLATLVAVLVSRRG